MGQPIENKHTHAGELSTPATSTTARRQKNAKEKSEISQKSKMQWQTQSSVDNVHFMCARLWRHFKLISTHIHANILFAFWNNGISLNCSVGLLHCSIGRYGLPSGWRVTGGAGSHVDRVVVIMESNRQKPFAEWLFQFDSKQMARAKHCTNQWINEMETKCKTHSDTTSRAKYFANRSVGE